MYVQSLKSIASVVTGLIFKTKFSMSKKGQNDTKFHVRVTILCQGSCLMVKNAYAKFQSHSFSAYRVVTKK